MYACLHTSFQQQKYNTKSLNELHVFMSIVNKNKKLYLFTSKSKMNMELKKRIIRCLVWSVGLYAAETWTLTKTDRDRIEAFELSLWRKMERISWIDKVSNVNVLKRVDEQRQMLESNRQRKLRWLGHILRHDSFLGVIMEGRMLGNTPRGAPRIQMIDDMINHKDYVGCKRAGIYGYNMR